MAPGPVPICNRRIQDLDDGPCCPRCSTLFIQDEAEVQLAALNRDRLATGSLIQDACEVLACLRGSETCHVYIVQRCCGKGQGSNLDNHPIPIIAPTAQS